MTPESFRKHGYQVIDWIARLHGTDRNLSGRVAGEPGEIRAQAAARPAGRRRAVRRDAARRRRGAHAGDHALAVAQLLRLLSRPTTPARPSSATCSRPGLGVQGMLWATSPACTELETHVLDWVVRHARPARPSSSRRRPGGGVIQDTASSASPVRLCWPRANARRGYASNVARRCQAVWSPTPRRRPIRRSRRRP